MRDYARQEYIKRDKSETALFWIVRISLLILFILFVWAVVTVDWSKPIPFDLP